MVFISSDIVIEYWFAGSTKQSVSGFILYQKNGCWPNSLTRGARSGILGVSNMAGISRLGTRS